MRVNYTITDEQGEEICDHFLFTSRSAAKVLFVDFVKNKICQHMSDRHSDVNMAESVITIDSVEFNEDI